MIKLVRAHLTSFACPSQWDAWDADGERYYLRYRWGQGTVEDALNGVLLAEFRYGNSLDGVISLEDFAEKAGIDVSEALNRGVRRTEEDLAQMPDLAQIRMDELALERRERIDSIIARYEAEHEA